ncbi:DNA topoisomerase IB [Actinosynnema sp. NPDC020468]|uniref:DNA topoisomerase IB n=1 Tax=Actinosynnema sp. NPDC020468 TaxID=3154488 RepID=UPI0033EED346
MRLRRSDPASPGWRRRARGRGFGYTDADGAPLPPDAVARIKALVIPPAWRDVWVSPHPNGHIQAVGTDAAGRRQYLYHERWRQNRDEEKHDRVLTLAPALPAFRRAITADLRRRGRGRARVLAVALATLDRGVFRVGGDSYAEDNGTHGVATLLCSHVTVHGSEVDFRYPAKGGIEFTTTLEHPDLARAVAALKRAGHPDERLLTDSTGHEVASDEVNARFKELVGDEHTVKDLRTWHATVSAAVAFARADRPSSARARKRLEAEVIREVSELLGNTPAVARKSYVDPRVVEAFHRGEVIKKCTGRTLKKCTDRTKAEREVIRLLSQDG